MLNNRSKLLITAVFSTIVIFTYFLSLEDETEQKLIVILNTSVLIQDGIYAKFDRSLCQHPQPEKEYQATTKVCPKRVVTVKQGGRLCNQIWEYLAVWAAAKRVDLEPYVPTCLYNTVSGMYDSLTLGKFEDIAHCPLNESSFVTSNFYPSDKRKNLIFPMYVTLPDLILDYRKDFPKEFVLRKDLAEESQRQLGLLRVPEDTVYVGVHIRRTDYEEYLKKKVGMEPADKSFYEKAMKVFEMRYKHLLFVIVSDDPDWCYENFGKRKNVYLIGYGRTNSAQVDLAILSSCNHTIFDYGSYGTWGAVMAGGETIYYRLSKGIASGVGQILNWTKV